MEDFTLEDYYQSLCPEVTPSYGSREMSESDFLLSMTDELLSAGAIGGFESSHYNPRGMRVDGYWFNEEESSLDLFVVDYDNRPCLETLTKTDVNSNFKRLEKFFMDCVDKRFYENLEGLQIYGLARDIYDLRNRYSKVNLYLISERNLSDRMNSIDNIIFNQWSISYHVWDMSRFYRQYTSAGAKEDLIVDFNALYGAGLQCLPAHLKNDDYESYLLVMPAKVLADLYGRYGARLLEQNVRCFLQARGNVNKGIRATIISEPGMFFAYNNGITATAKEVVIDKSSSGIFIKQIKDFQIVNGGQTTASLFHTHKNDDADLEKVFVQMKLSVVDEAKNEGVVPKISEYANTQNKVNAADFFSNHPFHVRMEEFSRRLWAPPVPGALRESKWFYERARGQYADAQIKLTPAGRKKFQTECPQQRMFTKTDLAKFENVWDEKPTFVNFGAQKNFAKYAERIGKEWEKTPDNFNERYYKRAIARAILFRRAEKVISGQPWYQGGYRANIVAYSLAMISEYCKCSGLAFDFMQVWKNQYISPATISALEIIGKFVSDDISCPPQGISNISEWCKKDACWTRLKEKVPMLDGLLPKRFISELLSSDSVGEEVKDAKKTQKIDNGIEAQAHVLKITGNQWGIILEVGSKKGIFTPKEVSILEIATRIPKQLPTEKQALVLLDVLSKANTEGICIVS